MSLLLSWPAVLMAQRDDDALLRDLIEQWADQNDSESVPDDLVE